MTYLPARRHSVDKPQSQVPSKDTEILNTPQDRRYKEHGGWIGSRVMVKRAILDGPFYLNSPAKRTRRRTMSRLMSREQMTA